MSTVTTAFASIKSTVEIGFDSDPDLIKQWVEGEFIKGRAAHQRFLDKGRRPKFATKSEPFGLGFAFDEAWVADPTDPWLDENGAGHYTTRIITELWAQRDDAKATADALIDFSAESSMAPLMAHYESEALQEAMGTLAGFGTFTNSGFITHNVIDFRHEAARNKEATGSNMPVEWFHDDLLYKIKSEAEKGCTLGNFKKDCRVPLQVAANDDVFEYGSKYVASVTAPQVMFLVMSEGSRAYARGEAVWAIHYQPNIYEFPDKETGEIIRIPGLYDVKGYSHVIATYRSMSAAKDARDDLQLALRAVRDADSERIRENQGEEETETMFEKRLRRAARPRYSTL